MPGTRSRPYWGVGVPLAALTLAVVLPLTNPMTEGESVDLEIELSRQDDDAWRFEEVDPAFAMDGSPFFIEPAAGPSDSGEGQPCTVPFADEMGCDHQMTDE